MFILKLLTIIDIIAVIIEKISFIIGKIALVAKNKNFFFRKKVLFRVF